MPQFSEQAKATYRASFAPNATDAQWALFISECERRDLVPGVHVVFKLQNEREYNKQLQAYTTVEKVVLITTINALRLIAKRSGDFRGYGRTTYFYSGGADGKPDFSPIPLGKTPHAVSVEMYHKDWLQPVIATARFDAYAKFYKSGDKETVTFMWANRGEEQLAKCAEALGLRMISPEECGSLYIAEELPAESVQETSPAPTAAPVVVPEPTVAPAVNQAAGAVETRQPFATLATNTEPTPGTETTAFPLTDVQPALVAKPAAPAPPRRPGPPAPKPPAAPIVPPTGRLPERQLDDHETIAELNAVADACARDKDPVPAPVAPTVPFVATDADVPDNIGKPECQAFYGADDTCALPPDSPIHTTSPQRHDYIAPKPATEPASETAPIQAIAAAPTQVVAAEPATQPATGDTPATKDQYTSFINGRAAKIVRDKLAAVKGANVLMKDYLLRKSGKKTLPVISAAKFEEMISAVESVSDTDAIVAILKG